MSHQINIALCANERYAPGLEAAVSGLLTSIDPAQFFKIWIIDGGLQEATRSRLLARVAEVSNAEVTFIEPPLERFSEVKTSRYHISAYLRLALPELVQETDLIYLDSDTLVLGSVSEPYGNHQTNSSPASAAADWETHSLAQDSEKAAASCGLTDCQGYFNSGVLLLDLDDLRELNFTDRACEMLAEIGEHVRFADQFALNALLAGRWSELSPCWNTPAWAFDDQEDNHLPGILHFTNSAPWLSRCYSPSQALFERIALEREVPLPKPEKSLVRNMTEAFVKWLLAPLRVIWHSTRLWVTGRRGGGAKQGERQIVLYWWRYFIGGPERLLRYHRRIREIRRPSFKLQRPSSS